tara:strand:- start:6639 stop:6821 length:183 start_codon:yes stop_codon:yes gene_type:complete
MKPNKSLSLKKTKKIIQKKIKSENDLDTLVKELKSINKSIIKENDILLKAYNKILSKRKN